MKINVEKSLELAKRIRAEKKACWQNAIYAQDCVPDALYIEGWAVSAEGLVFEHGWLEDSNEVLDPTLQDCSAYFPALMFSLKETREHVISGSGKLPIVRRYGRGGMGSPEYLASYQEAWVYFVGNYSTGGLSDSND